MKNLTNTQMYMLHDNQICLFVYSRILLRIAQFYDMGQDKCAPSLFLDAETFANREQLIEAAQKLEQFGLIETFTTTKELLVTFPRKEDLENESK